MLEIPFILSSHWSSTKDLEAIEAITTPSAAVAPKMYKKSLFQEWFYFNDDSVRKIDSKEVLGRDPYILVYERIKGSGWDRVIFLIIFVSF